MRVAAVVTETVAERNTSSLKRVKLGLWVHTFRILLRQDLKIMIQTDLEKY